MTVLDRLASLAVAAEPGRRGLVAIDGAGCSGKSTLADRLAATIGSQRPVMRASIDDFMNPREVATARDMNRREVAEDTFGLDALPAELLDPLSRPVPAAVGPASSTASPTIPSIPPNRLPRRMPCCCSTGFTCNGHS